jgi:hypothetical protein
MKAEQFQRITCFSKGLQNPAAVLKIRVSTVQFRPPAPMFSRSYGFFLLSNWTIFPHWSNLDQSALLVWQWPKASPGCGWSPWTRALKLGDVSALTPISFMQLPVVALCGFLLVDEKLDRWIVLGAAIIFAAQRLHRTPRGPAGAAPRDHGAGRGRQARRVAVSPAPALGYRGSPRSEPRRSAPAAGTGARTPGARPTAGTARTTPDRCVLRAASSP